MVINFENVEFIIFDFDGTLFNGLEAIRLGVSEAIERNRLDVDYDKAIDEVAALIQKLMPIPIPKIILQSYQLLQSLTFLDGMSYFKKLRIGLNIYRSYLKNVENMRLYDGVEEMLAILHGRGIRFAIFTSGPRDSVVKKLERFEIKDYFPDNLIIGAQDVSPGRVKPDPEGIEIIFKNAGLTDSILEKGGLIMVGDMRPDILAAKRAFNGRGIGSIGIKSGYDSKIVDSNPDILLEKTTQILTYLH
ncbi:MAG: HAD family hydrolase [Promethearchaeota archaeon]